MKKVLFALSAVFALIAVIIALQNVALTCMYQMFMDTISGGLLMPVLVVFSIGFFSGLSFGVGLMMKKNKPEDVDSLNF